MRLESVLFLKYICAFLVTEIFKLGCL